MKKVFVLIILSLFVIVGNVAAADLEGTWEGCMYCSNDVQGEGSQKCEDLGEYWRSVISHDGGDFFTTYGQEPQPPGELCGGVIDGNNIYMTCDGTIAHGVIKGKVIYIINHVPADAKTCKGTATLVPDPD